MPRSVVQSLAAIFVLALLPLSAQASFHFMQIEQALGGVGGDTSQQAVQLRMRSGGQSFVSGTRIVAHDAAGANPVVLVQFAANVSNSVAGSRILVATPALAAAFGVTPDASMTAQIPASYLAAGRITFETSGGTIYWSLCWGGASYTGATTGQVTNDADGDFGPCFAGPLPSLSNTTLQFTGLAGDISTTNAADYAESVSPGSVTNNAGASFGLVSMAIFADGFEN